MSALLAAALTACGSSGGSSASSSTPPPQPVRADTGRALQISSAPTTGPACTTTAAGALLVTAACVDPKLNQPYVDKDEHRTVTDPQSKVSVDIRYVHGGFTGTNSKFSFYFPAKYQGRFFEFTYPTISFEDAQPANVVFAALNNAYVVSTNNDGGLPKAGELGAYRTDAASAKFSRVVAAQVYADSSHPRGYIYGPSGGGYQTIGALENTDGVWDGGVPTVPGTPNSIPSNMTSELLALRVLRDKLPRIADAMEPGGSGNPYAGLDADQQSALREVSRLGFPLRGWWDYANLNGGAYFEVAGGIRIVDPTYADDFWSKLGYAGSEPSVRAARVQADTTVSAVVGSPVTGLTLTQMPAGDLSYADLVITSGAAAGKTLSVQAAKGSDVTLVTGADASVTAAIRPGDHVRLDNSWTIALEYYPRYQVPSPDMYGWNQYRDAAGKPLYPQRTALTGAVFTTATSGSLSTGAFHGKMIMLGDVMDAEAYAWSADWYRQRVQARQGARMNDDYRIWYLDNAGHTGPPTTSSLDHLVSYGGEVEQALLDLDAWVADGTPPPASTGYHVDADTQVQLAPAAAQRQGVQPLVSLNITKVGDKTLTPAVTAVAAPGQKVSLTAHAQVPSRAGEISKVEWDFDSTGKFADGTKVDKPTADLTVSTSHTFTTPGTYFAVVRVTAQRDGDQKTPFTLIQNLARVRIVVK
ncbi:PKD domain-containing protein [Frankia sp. AgB1.9]|nr:PKD domain-containing protein [Frankia sp. AgW1.1]MBL7549579.1 PKD domain-containing protein [Frankia sp. AgB1.9]MBL7620441.1 PKD domain-containing protein [Frankia sp. AgB1.8]